MAPADILREMPADATIAEMCRTAAETSEKDRAIAQWGTAVRWSDLHSSGPYRIDYDQPADTQFCL